jgi:hypothetical protein
MSLSVQAQSEGEKTRLQVPARNIKPQQSQPMMENFPGYISSATKMEPLAHYQRSRLGRWDIERKADAEDSVLGIELRTESGPVRIRFEVLVGDRPFRAAREETIDQLLAIARGDESSDESENAEKPVEAESDDNGPAEVDESDQENEADDYEQSMPQKNSRMVAYAKSRGDRATRYELRRRVAELAGGPSLLRTSRDFGTARSETMSLFAFLDADEDAVISKEEQGQAAKAIEQCDMNADSRVDWVELLARLKPRSARRVVSAKKYRWQAWDANESEYVEDLNVRVSFSDQEGKSKLTLDDYGLAEPWSQTISEMRYPNENESPSRAISIKHPKQTIVLTAAQYEGMTQSDQISIGVAVEGDALFRHVDRDGDWSLSSVERRDLEQRITELDLNDDQRLEADEMPGLIRVCLARGAVADQALLETVAFLQPSEESDEPGQNIKAPEWFISMDKDGDRTLTETEFLGGAEAFSKLDADDNGVLSVEEAASVE